MDRIAGKSLRKTLYSNAMEEVFGFKDKESKNLLANDITVDIDIRETFEIIEKL